LRAAAIRKIFLLLTHPAFKGVRLAWMILLHPVSGAGISRVKRVDQQYAPTRSDSRQEVFFINVGWGELIVGSGDNIN